MVVDTNDEGANDVIASILLRAGPYVQSYKKHTKTAKDLLLGPMYNCAALQFETFAMSVQCCFDLSGLLQRSVMPLVRRKRKPGRRWRTCCVFIHTCFGNLFCFVLHFGLSFCCAA